MRLSLTMLPLLVLLCGQVDAAEVVTVAMDAREVSAPLYRELGLLELQRELALRLTEAGFAVVAPQRQPQIQLRFTVEHGVLSMKAAAAGGATLTRQLERDKGRLETFHLEAIHRAVALVREAERTLPPPPASQPATTPSSRPASRPSSLPVAPASRPAPPPPAAVEPWHLELGLGAMALYRPGGADLLLRAHGRIGVLGGLGLRGAVGFSPSWADQLTVYEISAQGGLSWRFPLTSSLYLEPGLFGGLLQHIYSVERAADGSGLRWDLLGNVVLELGWRVHRYLALRLFLSPGLSTTTRSHSVGGREIWRRSLFRLESGACAVVVLR